MRILRTLMTASALAVCLMATACGGTNTGKGSTSTGGNVSLAVAEILSKAAAANPSAARYTFDLTTASSSSGNMHEAVAYTLNPKVTDIALSSSTNGQGQTLETIETGTATYINTGSGRWLKTPASATQTDPATLNPNKLTINLNTVTGLQMRR